jgi:cytochrome b561
MRKWFGDPLFYIKIGFIALAMITGRLIWNRVFRDPSAADVPIAASTKALAAASLFLWIAAITAGRLTAYLFTNSGLRASIH